MTNAAAAALALASGAPTWVVIIVIVLTNGHVTKVLADCWADVFDAAIASRARRWRRTSRSYAVLVTPSRALV